MSTKRQAIWLVSILGIMVVLSAYYLLTDDQRMRKVSDMESQRLAHLKDTVDSSLQASDVEVKIQPIDLQDNPQKPSHLSAWSSQDYFIAVQMKRHEILRKKTEQLMSTIADTKQKPESIAQATQELETISDLQEKIDHLEEELHREYPQAVIVQEGDFWRVSIQSNKLEKSQGVSIIDKVVSELEVKPEQVKLQTIRP